MINRELFGHLKDGRPVYRLTMANAVNTKVEVINYGGIIRSLEISDRNHNPADVVLGYDHIEDYESDPYFMGALIGRCANRISRGKFLLGGKEYHLPQNDHENHLHGGFDGFHKKLWDVDFNEKDVSGGIILTLDSPDGEMGYPGDVTVSVRIQLSDENELIFTYQAESTKETIINLTHHGYFNLSGNSANPILDHRVKINAQEITTINENLITNGRFLNVADTPFDFIREKKIGLDIQSAHPQMVFAGGFDHNWVIDHQSERSNFAASAYDPSSGRMMEVFTTQPGIQFYSGNFFDGRHKGKNGIKFSQHSGFCFETQHYPDTCNQPGFPTIVLMPGEKYYQQTIYKFSHIK